MMTDETSPDSPGSAHQRLPVEVVEYIFKYLPYADRKRSSLVCREWYRASTSARFLREELIVLHQPKVDDLRNLIQDWKYTAKDIVNFSICEVVIDVNWMDFWEHFGPKMRSLCMKRVYGRHVELAFGLRKCINLEKLEFDDCSDLFRDDSLMLNKHTQELLQPCLHQLKQLSFVKNNFLTDLKMMILMSLTHSIREVKLVEVGMVYRKGVLKRFYPTLDDPLFDLETLGGCQFDVTFLSALGLMKCFTMRANTLTSVDLSSALISDEYMIKICQTPGLHLEKLILDNSTEWGNQGLRAIANHQKGLKVLSISENKNIDDSGFTHACQQLVQLEDLSVVDCKKLSDHGISYIGLLSNLKKLVLRSDNEAVSASGLVLGLPQIGFWGLESLKIHTRNPLAQVHVLEAVKKMPFLIAFSYSNDYDGMCNEIFNSLITNRQSLRQLKIKRCLFLTDAATTGHLSEEEICSDLCCIPKSVLSPAQGKPININHLQGLVQLDLEGCKGITDATLVHMRLYHLEKLNLRYCSRITHRGIYSLATHSPYMVDLYLDGCSLVDDNCVTIIVIKMKNLRCLSLQGCSKLTTGATREIKHNAKELRFLNIAGCPLIQHDEHLHRGMLADVKTASIPFRTKKLRYVFF